MSETYPEKVRIVFKQFPLQMHKFAFQAGKASIAAQKQNKFWEISNKLFENYKSLSDEKIRELAEAVGLDMATFDKDLKDAAADKIIRTDMLLGQQAGVRGVPSIFLNGKASRGRDLAGFKREIDAELKRASK